MSIEKTLQKLRSQIEELNDELKNFSDSTVHPTVADADNLQARIHALLESTAVFKFQKGNSEISPSFNIHAKVSEKAEAIAQVAAITPEPVQKPVIEAPVIAAAVEPVKPAPVAEKVVEAAAKVVEEPPVVKLETSTDASAQKPKPALSVGLNDKFRFINELFLQNAGEYNIVLEQINTLQTWADAEIYISSLKNVYGWKDSHETFKYFCSVVRRRYDA